MAKHTGRERRTFCRLHRGSFNCPWEAYRWFLGSCNQKWGLSACSSKANKEASWWKRMFALFWIQATEGGDGGWTPVQRLTLPTETGGKSFYRQKEVAPCRNGTVSSESHLEIVHAVVWPTSSWLLYLQLIFSTRVSLFPFSWGQFWKLWLLMSWLQSGPHVVNFFHLMGVSVSTELKYSVCTELKYYQNIIHSPWEGATGAWLCLLTKLLLFCPVWLSSFALIFSYFSDETYSLVKIFSTDKRQVEDMAGKGP